MMTPVLLSAALLLLLLPSGAPSSRTGLIPITIIVKNSVKDIPPKTYKTNMVIGGIFLGAMRRLRDANTGFRFRYTENADFGPFLVCVNGLSGKDKDRTYWELLAKKPGKEIVRLNVGIGCYIPDANEEIILNFNKY